MYIGIIGAMRVEIEKIQSLMKEKEVKKICNTKFIKGRLYDKDIVLCVCDEGKVNSAMATQIMICNFKLKLIINMGVAGSLSSRLKMCDLLIAQATCQHDFDISDLGYKKGLILGIDKVYIPCDINLANKFCDLISKNENITNTSRVLLGNIATGDKFVTDKSIIRDISETFDVMAVDMESSSIGQVCYANNIKYVCIRAISDTGDGEEFRVFLNKAVEILTLAVCDFLENVKV